MYISLVNIGRLLYVLQFTYNNKKGNFSTKRYNCITHTMCISILYIRVYYFNSYYRCYSVFKDTL